MLSGPASGEVSEIQAGNGAGRPDVRIRWGNGYRICEIDGRPGFVFFESSRTSYKESFMLKIHHLGHSQSERIVWLCEELEVPYELEKYTRDPVTQLSPPELKALHPLGAAPLIEADAIMLANRRRLSNLSSPDMVTDVCSMGPTIPISHPISTGFTSP